MDAEAWIAVVAVIVAIAAAAISVWQARIATKQTKHAQDAARSAEEQAAEARKANQLTREQMDRAAVREEAEVRAAEDAAQREAEMVALSLRGSGGSVALAITNSGSRPIHHLQLMEVRADEPGPWASWAMNRFVSGNLADPHRLMLEPGEKTTMAVWLLAADGSHEPQLPAHVEVQYRFRDAGGQWWLSSLLNGVSRISPPAI
ncbi:hypothetical protein [Streptomyces sp. NEAU-H3]|uniref:hypothetical protein n=1 Tax=Streptomyces sp. NEAU-H3 TaxID=2720636 RepID=UPI00143C1276|nr:hypothetical protein [Streptomyces sp. NEAU-H3]NJA56730.1 hypothetical protein [Streptomyces sp. NEAU-H3]